MSEMVKFSMKKVELRQFAIVADGTTAGDVKSMRVLLRFALRAEAHCVAASTKYELVTDDDPDGGAPAAVIAEVRCLFEVDAEGWDREVGTGDGAAVPKWLLDIFAVHTVGTARGLIYAKAEDTSMHGFILPPIDVDSMTKEDLPLKKS